MYICILHYSSILMVWTFHRSVNWLIIGLDNGLASQQLSVYENCLCHQWWQSWHHDYYQYLTTSCAASDDKVGIMTTLWELPVPPVMPVGIMTTISIWQPPVPPVMTKLALWQLSVWDNLLCHQWWQSWHHDYYQYLTTSCGSSDDKVGIMTTISIWQPPVLPVMTKLASWWLWGFSDINVTETPELPWCQLHKTNQNPARILRDILHQSHQVTHRYQVQMSY